MVTLLTVTVFVLILLCIGLIFLYKINSEDIKDLERAIERLTAENEHIKAKQRVFEKRFIKLSEPADKVVISHQYDDSKAPGFEDF